MPQTIVAHADTADFAVGLRPFFAYRDLGVHHVTDGRFGAHVIRAVPDSHAEPQWHAHTLGFQFVYILHGWVEFEYEDIGRVRLETGDTAYQPPGIRHRELAHSEDVEILEITMPGTFDTRITAAPGHRPPDTTPNTRDRG